MRNISKSSDGDRSAFGGAASEDYAALPVRTSLQIDHSNENLFKSQRPSDSVHIGYLFLAFVWWSLLVIAALTQHNPSVRSISPSHDYLLRPCGQGVLEGRGYLYFPKQANSSRVEVEDDLLLHTPICLAQCPFLEDELRHTTLRDFDPKTPELYGNSIAETELYTTHRYSDYVCLPDSPSLSPHIAHQLDLYSFWNRLWLSADQLADHSVTVVVCGLTLAMLMGVPCLILSAKSPGVVSWTGLGLMPAVSALFLIFFRDNHEPTSVFGFAATHSMTLAGLVSACVLCAAVTLFSALVSFRRRLRLTSVAVTTSVDAVKTLPWLSLIPCLFSVIMAVFLCLSLFTLGSTIVSESPFAPIQSAPGRRLLSLPIQSTMPSTMPLTNLSLTSTKRRGQAAVRVGPWRRRRLEQRDDAIEDDYDDHEGRVHPRLFVLPDDPVETALVAGDEDHKDIIVGDPLLNGDDIIRDLRRRTAMADSRPLDEKSKARKNIFVNPSEPSAKKEAETQKLATSTVKPVVKKERNAEKRGTWKEIKWNRDLVVVPIRWYSILKTICFLVSTAFIAEFIIAINQFLVAGWTCVWYFSVPDMSGERTIEWANIYEATKRVYSLHLGTVVLLAAVHTLIRPLKTTFSLLPYTPLLRSSLARAALQNERCAAFSVIVERILSSVSGQTVTQSLLQGQDLLEAAAEVSSRSELDKAVGRLMRLGALAVTVPVLWCVPMLAALTVSVAAAHIPYYSDVNSVGYIGSPTLTGVAALAIGMYTTLVLTTAAVQVCDTIVACYRLERADRNSALICTPDSLTILTSEILAAASHMSQDNQQGETLLSMDPMEAFSFDSHRQSQMQTFTQTHLTEPAPPAPDTYRFSADSVPIKTETADVKSGEAEVTFAGDGGMKFDTSGEVATAPSIEDTVELPVRLTSIQDIDTVTESAIRKVMTEANWTKTLD